MFLNSPQRYSRSLINRTGGTILFYWLISIAISTFAMTFYTVLYIVFTADPASLSGGADTQEVLSHLESDLLFNSVLILVSPLLAFVTALIGSILTRVKLRPLLQPSRLQARAFAVITITILGLSSVSSYLVYPIDAFLSLFNFSIKPPDFLQLPVDQPLYLFLYVIGICIAAPVAEEMLFRGVILHALRPYGNGFAILISALFFGLIHGNFSQAPGAFVIGIALGIVTLRTRSLLPAIFIHLVNNTISVVEEYLAIVLQFTDAVIIIIDAIIIIVAILLLSLNWSKIKDFLSIFQVRQAQELSPQESSPFWRVRWRCFWTSWPMLIALFVCILLLLVNGIQPL